MTVGWFPRHKQIGLLSIVAVANYQYIVQHIANYRQSSL